MERPHRNNLIAMRPSRFLLGAMVGFIAVASAAVFQCVLARFDAFDACVAAIVCIATLSLAARRWMLRQPVALELHADSITTCSKSGETKHRRIVGCAQIGGRVLALTLASDRKDTLLIAVDSIGPDLFRQLAVNARRAAQAYL